MEIWEIKDIITNSKIRRIIQLSVLSLFLALGENNVQAQVPKTKITSTKNVATKTLEKKLEKLRDEYIYTAIKNHKKNTMPVDISYGESTESLKKYADELDFEMPKFLNFDAEHQQILLDDIKMKIEIPTFIFTYSTLVLGEIKIEVSDFIFKSFRYDKEKDKFFFRAKFTYKCINWDFLDGILKGVGLGKFLEKIPFKKKNLIRLVKLGLENEAKASEQNIKTIKTTYDMQAEDWSHITDVNVTIEY